MRVLVLDTETTGLSKTKILNQDTLDQWPNIVQLSYIVYDLSLNKIENSKDYIIRVPENIIITKEVSKFHGITNEISSTKGVLISEVLTELFCFMKEVDSIIGHNISFDINMIKVELLRIIYSNQLSNNQQLKNYKYNLSFIINYKNICCTLQDSIKFCNITSINKSGKTYLKYPKLIELHQKLFDSSPNNLHNSYNDVLVTLRCFMKLKHDVDINDECNSFKEISSQLGIF